LGTLRFDPDYVPPSATERKSDDVSSDDEMNEDLDSWSGNRSRRLWKATCVQAALSVCITTPAFRSYGHLSRVGFQSNLSDQERLLFASLAPTPQTATILKTACRTWEDHLWAEICIICEEKASRELFYLTSGSFWDGGVDAVEKGMLDIPRAQTQQDEEAWRKDVMSSLDNLKAINVLDGFVPSFRFQKGALTRS